jgi:uncharacterized protein (TIGR03437 family)
MKNVPKHKARVTTKRKRRMIRTHFYKILLAVLALAICTGTMQAASTTLAAANPTTLTLTCDLSTGITTSQNVTISLLAGQTTSQAVTVTESTGTGPITVPASQTVTSSGGKTFALGMTTATGCGTATQGQQITMTFTPLTGGAVTTVVTINLINPQLATPTGPLTLSCDVGGGQAGPTANASIAVSKAGLAGQLVTVTASTGGIVLPPAATVGPTTTTVPFAFHLPPGCGGYTNGQSITLTFTPAVGAAVNLTATMTITTPTLASAQSAGINLACDTMLGPTPTTVGIVTYSGNGPYTITAASGASTVVLSAVAGTSVSSPTVATNWTARGAAGCKGWVNNAVVNLTFTPSGGGQALIIPATLILTNSGSALALSPSSVTIRCTKSGQTYSNITSPVVYVSSAANYGTPFSVDASQGNAPAAYISATTNPASNAVASSTAIPLTITTMDNTCGNLPVGNTTSLVKLANPPAADKVITVTVQVGSNAPLTATTAAMTYTKGSATYTPKTSVITGPAGTFFQVDQSSLPLWASPTTTSGTLTAGTANLVFQPTAGADTLAPGTYTATVNLKVAFALDSQVTLTLQVKSATAALVIAERTTQNLTWVLGAPTIPSLMITPISTSDTPIPYTVTTAAVALALLPQVSTTSGLAYSFGPPISVTLPQSAFSAAQPGNVLHGTVTITPTNGGGATTVDIYVTVLSPNATISSASTMSLPTALPGDRFTVVLFGSGFVPDSLDTLKTTVGVLSGNSVVTDANIVPTVQNTTTIYLQITVPQSPDPFLPFSGAGGNVTIAVCNPSVGAPCFTSTSTVTLHIGVNPIVQSVTSASSYKQATPPALTAVAPYDILSLFGTNFCISGGTGCTGGNAILYGVVDPDALRYLTQLTPDTTGTKRNLKVSFQTHEATPVWIADAPLLFATNSQINLIVPDAVKAYYGSAVDIVVTFGYGAPASQTLLASSPFSVTIAATNPGIFAMNGNGQGDAAALTLANTLVAQTNPVGLNTTSEQIQLYVTGLGIPDSDGSSGVWSAGCMPATGYFPLASAQAAAVAGMLGLPTPPALTSNDGLVLQGNLFPNATPAAPCFISDGTNVPAVSVGNVTATVKYAGWVSGSVAGLYQINVELPATGSSFSGGTKADGTSGTVGNTVPIKLPIVVSSGSMSSQLTGVNVWVVNSPTVTVAPIAGTINVALGTSPAPNPFTVSGGSGGVTYSLPSTSVMPDGITMAADGSLSGIPTTAGTFPVVIKVTDGNGWKGFVTVTFNIAGS